MDFLKLGDAACERGLCASSPWAIVLWYSEGNVPGNVILYNFKGISLSSPWNAISNVSHLSYLVELCFLKLIWETTEFGKWDQTLGYSNSHICDIFFFFWLMHWRHKSVKASAYNHTLIILLQRGASLHCSNLLSAYHPPPFWWVMFKTCQIH